MCVGEFRGKLRRQNEKAHLIGHVKDVGVDSKHENPATRIYLTSVAQPWHVDGVDVVGESSLCGGLLQLCLSITLFERLLCCCAGVSFLQATC
jgi:hypothetical protein